MKRIFLPAIFLLLHAFPAMAGESVIKDLQGMNCHVYAPENIVAGTTYQLVVGVHGAGGNGKGAGGLAGWANRGDVIVIGPSFVSRGSGYQNGNGVHAEKLIALAETLGKTYNLKDKMFIHGFSGGAQFAHRFAMLHAETIPREQLITFMKKHPPALWKEKPGAAKLLQQCEGAAMEWLAAAKAKGLWSNQTKQEFQRFTKGIDIDTGG